MKKLLMLILVAGMLIGAGCNVGTDPDIKRWKDNHSPKNIHSEKNDFLVLGGGGGGDAKAGNFTLEAIRINPNPKGRDSLFGLGTTFIFNGKGIPANYEDASGDWSDWYRLEQQIGTLEDEGIRQTGPEWGIFGKFGLELIENTGVFGTIFGGLSFSKEAQLYHSSLGEPHYFVDKGTTDYGLYGLGISYIPEKNSNMLFQIDYDNRRGITFGLGWKF